MRKTTRVVSGTALGAVTFAAAHLIIISKWSVWFGGTSAHAAYWMNSADSAPILFTAAAVSAATAVATVFSVGRRNVGTGAAIMDAGGAEPRLLNAAAAAGSITAGAVIAMVCVLFTRPGGPGTLFPIAIVMGGLVLCFASVLGAAAGTAVLMLRSAK
jgi:hypothetical protein